MRTNEQPIISKGIGFHRTGQKGQTKQTGRDTHNSCDVAKIFPVYILEPKTFE